MSDHCTARLMVNSAIQTLAIVLSKKAAAFYSPMLSSINSFKPTYKLNGLWKIQQQVKSSTRIPVCQQCVRLWFQLLKSWTIGLHGKLDACQSYMQTNHLSHGFHISLWLLFRWVSAKQLWRAHSLFAVRSIQSHLSKEEEQNPICTR